MEKYMAAGKRSIPYLEKTNYWQQDLKDKRSLPRNEIENKVRARHRNREKKKTNYWQQDLNLRQHMRMVGTSSAITIVTSWLYYRSVWAIFILSPLGIWFYKNLRKQYEEQQKSKFLVKFKEMIQNMASSLNTGYSVENALRETQKEMLLIYPKEDVISRELAFMVRQLQMQIPAEQVIQEFSERVNLEDVRNFSTVFATAKRTGGDMIAIIRNTVRQIGDKIDVKREIDTILAAKRYEFYVMSLIPYFIIAYMQFSFPEFMDVLYHNVIGIGVMSACLGVYLGAYVLGIKLIKIEV